MLHKRTSLVWRRVQIPGVQRVRKSRECGHSVCRSLPFVVQKKRDRFKSNLAFFEKHSTTHTVLLSDSRHEVQAIFIPFVKIDWGQTIATSTYGTEDFPFRDIPGSSVRTQSQIDKKSDLELHFRHRARLGVVTRVLTVLTQPVRDSSYGACQDLSGDKEDMISAKVSNIDGRSRAEIG